MAKQALDAVDVPQGQKNKPQTLNPGLNQIKEKTLS